jgi:hypothetical protein
MHEPSDDGQLDLAFLLRATGVKRGTRLNWVKKDLVDDPPSGRYVEWHALETTLVRELANALPGLADVQALRGSRGDDLIAAMQSASDSLATLHIVVELDTLACSIIRPGGWAVDALPLGCPLVVLRLDAVAREALEAFRRFARHVTIDFADGRRKSTS